MRSHHRAGPTPDPEAGAGRAAVRWLRRLLWALLLAPAFALALAAAAPAPPPGKVPAAPAQAGGERPVLVAHIDGAIGPASDQFLAGALRTAAERGAALVVIRIDTPGGLDTSMREMIRNIIASPVPVATWVAPGGARAASAGTYILYASHIAAMAPATNLGAATPVALGGGAPAGGDQTPQDDEQAAPSGASEAKAVNDAVAYIRGLAELRGRDADWAERAVREASSLDARAALERGVIDVVAEDLESLLVQVDGRTVRLATGDATLATRGAAVEHLRPDWRFQLLAVITNPNVALLLMMLGVYGLVFEFMNPGALYPGVIGAICLLVGLYALAVLPVNYAGAALIVLGLALIAAEAFAPSFGALGLGGGAAFVLGAMILIDTEAPEFRMSLPLIIGLAVATLGFAMLAARMALAAHRRRPTTGQEELIGCTGVVRDWSGGAGHVFARSERWRAVSDDALSAGDPIRVTAVNGLTLRVTRDGDAPPAR